MVLGRDAPILCGHKNEKKKDTIQCQKSIATSDPELNHAVCFLWAVPRAVLKFCDVKLCKFADCCYFRTM